MSINHSHPAIAERIALSMQTLGGFTEEMAANIERAARHIANQFVGEQKLMALSTRGLNGLIDGFCFNLTQRHADRQPGLPALALSTPEALPGSRLGGDAENAVLRQLISSAEIYGNSGDILLLLSDAVLPGIHQTLDELYHSRAISSVYIGPLTAQDANNISTTSSASTITIPLDAIDLPQLHELSLFILNYLSDMIPARVFNFQ